MFQSSAQIGVFARSSKRLALKRLTSMALTLLPNRALAAAPAAVAQAASHRRPRVLHLSKAVARVKAHPLSVELETSSTSLLAQGNHHHSTVLLSWAVGPYRTQTFPEAPGRACLKAIKMP